MLGRSDDKVELECPTCGTKFTATAKEADKGKVKSATRGATSSGVDGRARRRDAARQPDVTRAALILTVPAAPRPARS